MQGLKVIFAIFYVVLFYFHAQAAKEAAKSSIKETKMRDTSFYNKAPQNVAALISMLILFSFFDIFIIDFNISEENLIIIKSIGLFFYATFSFLQLICVKKLGKFYSVEIQIFKEHKLATDGIYAKIRHPQYLFQILSDLGAGIFFLSYLILPIVVFIEFPIMLKRIKIEEEYLTKFFGEDYENYKRRSWSLFPKLF